MKDLWMLAILCSVIYSASGKHDSAWMFLILAFVIQAVGFFLQGAWQ